MLTEYEYNNNLFNALFTYKILFLPTHTQSFSRLTTSKINQEISQNVLLTISLNYYHVFSLNLRSFGTQSVNM